MTKLTREPLVHFIILGALLFAGHMLWQAHVTKADYTITVTAEEMERQALIFAGENRRQPTDEDLKALLFSHVEEQALMREAQRLGLGEDDTIIRRRLAQKMRFIIEDTAPPPVPETSDLKNWYQANIDLFKSLETRSFSHIYLSPETRGENITANAQLLLTQVKDSGVDWKTLGDPFMLKRDFKNLSATEVTRLFGKTFKAGIFSATGDNWQGPIESAFGLHIVRINKVRPQETPEFDIIRSEVEARWQAKTQRAANQEALKEVIRKYKIDVFDDNENLIVQ
ncbi:peptidyl-prolyl cis-trans isomerase [Hellea balneolensis]|uniref:peptidylprolyl isomerase n=1 Tax=Hellea balneolensis TaxID=287478 RepID=UPI0004258951|nr:peptidylprolyl isomerase [Hellea balneolensis]